MKNNDIINKIKTKTNMANILQFLNLLLAIVLTIMGTVLIVSLLMYLHEVIGFGWWACFCVSLLLPCFYSAIVNSLLKRIDDKIYDILLETDTLKNELRIEKILTNEQNIDNIEDRFQRLTIEDQIKLLNFIKENLITVDRFEEIKDLKQENILLLESELDEIELGAKCSGYSRKKIYFEDNFN